MAEDAKLLPSGGEAGARRFVQPWTARFARQTSALLKKNGACGNFIEAAPPCARGCWQASVVSLPLLKYAILGNEGRVRRLVALLVTATPQRRSANANANSIANSNANANANANANSIANSIANSNANANANASRCQRLAPYILVDRSLNISASFCGSAVGTGRSTF